MYEFVKNFYDMFGKDRDDLFCRASDEEMEHLSRLFGPNVEKITEFWREHQPDNLPLLAGAWILKIDEIFWENNSEDTTGYWLAKYGVYVFATTIGGDLVCIDTNDCKDGDASVLIADHGFCWYDDADDIVKIDTIPKRAAKEVAKEFLEKGVIALNYPNIKKCLTKLESSFLLFMEKLSRNEYGDIEDYFEESVSVLVGLDRYLREEGK